MLVDIMTLKEKYPERYEQEYDKFYHRRLEYGYEVEEDYWLEVADNLLAQAGLQWYPNGGGRINRGAMSYCIGDWGGGDYVHISTRISITHMINLINPVDEEYYNGLSEKAKEIRDMFQKDLKDNPEFLAVIAAAITDNYEFHTTWGEHSYRINNMSFSWDSQLCCPDDLYDKEYFDLHYKHLIFTGSGTVYDGLNYATFNEIAYPYLDKFAEHLFTYVEYVCDYIREQLQADYEYMTSEEEFIETAKCMDEMYEVED